MGALEFFSPTSVSGIIFFVSVFTAAVILNVKVYRFDKKR
jgi:hypothetical protein